MSTVDKVEKLKSSYGMKADKKDIV